MFPNVYGFHWSAGHLIFLGLFFVVVVAIATTVMLALARAWRHARQKRLDQVRWLAEFHDLPSRDRACRHECTGVFRDRKCERGFDCRGCPTHAAVMTPAAAEDEAPYGLSFPADRLYHRGHAWVREEPDGTMTAGLDDFGRRLIGKPDAVRLPQPGEILETNATAWTIRARGIDVRVLAPVDGEVVETGGPDSEFYLRLRASGDGFDTRHLLRGAEIRPWLSRELDRLQLALSGLAGRPALADGGTLLEDVPSSCPKADWDAVWGAVFLEP
jgi:glycine cleavage system H protein